MQTARASRIPSPLRCNSGSEESLGDGRSALWRWGSDTASVALAAFLVATSLVLYTPVLWAPERWGGDMIALAFLAMSGITMGLVFVLSASTALALWLQRKRRGETES